MQVNTAIEDMRTAPAVTIVDPATVHDTDEHLQRPTLLVVDDDAVSRLVLCSLLGGEYQIETAQRAEEARQRMAAIRPDVVLCDLVMPGACGDQFCRWLKRHPLWRFVPVIAVTRIDHPVAIAGLLEAGADDVVIKPVDPAQLRARLGAALRTRRHYLELAMPVRS